MTRKQRLCAFLVLAAALLTAPALALTVEEVKSPGGITAYAATDRNIPIIALSFSFDGGSALDPESRLGLSEMASALLDEGAGVLDSFAFQSELEDRAIQLRFSADPDSIRGSLITTASNAQRAFQLLRLAMAAPRFDAEPVERIRRQIMVRLARNAENPGRIAARRLYELLYPGHPYGRENDGTPETVAAITADDLRGWVRSRLARDRLTVAVAGDMAASDVAAMLDGVFGTLPASSGFDASLPQADVSASAVTDRIGKNLPQSIVYFGQPSLSRTDPDWYAATVADYVFGGGSFASRLMDEVREKRGLAYGVSSSLVPWDHGPIMTVAVGTRSEQVQESIDVIREEWRKMSESGPTAEELEGAKQYLTGAWPLRFISTGRVADILVQVQKDDLGLDYLDRRNSLIEAVTLEDVRRVSRRLYRPEALTVVVVGPLPAGG